MFLFCIRNINDKIFNWKKCLVGTWGIAEFCLIFLVEMASRFYHSAERCGWVRMKEYKRHPFQWCTHSGGWGACSLQPWYMWQVYVTTVSMKLMVSISSDVDHMCTFCWYIFNYVPPYPCPLSTDLIMPWIPFIFLQRWRVCNPECKISPAPSACILPVIHFLNQKNKSL